MDCSAKSIYPGIGKFKIFLLIICIVAVIIKKKIAKAEKAVRKSSTFARYLSKLFIMFEKKEG